jgi:hypothetical protein
VSEYRTLGFYLRLDFAPDGVLARLFDIDDVSESDPLAEATGPTADAAVAELVSTITFDTTDL